MMILCFLPGIWFTGVASLPFVAGAVMAGTARWIILTKYTNELYDNRYRATAISALSMLVGIFYVTATGLSGVIINSFGGVRMMYSLLGALSVIFVLPVSLALVRHDRRHAK